MHLGFPNHETVQLAITSGVIPEAMSLAPVSAGFDEDGTVWVKPTGKLPRAVSTELKQLGVVSRRSKPVPLVSLNCWPLLLPLASAGAEVQVGEKTPVLFEIYEDEHLPEVIREMLRLGNDRQGFRYLEQDGETRALLRVFGPPYYSLLRALERTDENAPRAYWEQAPRVWVQIGYRQELATRIKPPAGKLMLARPPREWTLIDEVPFRDVYEILDFEIPDAEVEWRHKELEQRIQVPMRLAQAGTADAEMWVLRENGAEQVEQLILRSDDQLLDRLAFAIGEEEGVTTTVIRVRPSKKAPPPLVLDGIGFRSYLKLPNLFLPIDKRLHPPLRRDAVSKLFGQDNSSITWLYPNDEGQFTPESLPDSAFRPLKDWIDYVLDRDHKPLEAWVASHRFDFDSYICKDEKPPKPSPSKRKKKSGQDQDDEEGGYMAEPSSKPVHQEEDSEPEAFEEADTQFEDPVSTVEPSELEKRLRELEAEFQADDSPIDSGQRRAAWREMGSVNAALKRPHDATVCWSNALWEEASVPTSTLTSWLDSEKQNAAINDLKRANFQRLADEDTHKPNTAVVAAYLAWAASVDSPPTSLIEQLPAVSRFLEKQEAYLPVRTVWLAWSALTRLAGDDVLALARARDRVLERLFRDGLRPELNMPLFLRSGSGSDTERLHLLRDHVLRLRERINQWVVEPRYKKGAKTKVYCDLMFAFGLARLGEAAEVQRLISRCQKAIRSGDQVHQWICDAYSQRIQQAADTNTPGRLDESLLERLQSLSSLERYKIDKLRNYSRILEPTERVDAYGRWYNRYTDELAKELAPIFDESDHERMRAKLRELLERKLTGKDASRKQLRILGAALELSPRLGESFAEDLLRRVEQVMRATKDIVQRVLLLEKGMFIAGTYDMAAYVHMCISHFEEEMAEIASTYLKLPYNTENKEKIDAIEALLSHSLRGMRKLGMRDEIGRVFGRLNEAVREELAKSKSNRVRSHRLMLNVAGSWFYFGQENEAVPIIDEVREVLFRGKLEPLDLRRLVCPYINALAQAKLTVVLPRLEELFTVEDDERSLAKLEDSMTTSSHFSISQLEVVENVVLALVSDDFSLDAESRRWLDEDEFLIRRRIHRDVRNAMGSAE